MPFKDREEAGRRLATALAHLKTERPVVLALVRGGLIVAAEIARELEAPLDIVLVRKIGVPFQPELAMGAVVDGDKPVIVRNDDVIRHTRMGEAEFDEVAARELKEIDRRRKTYLGGRDRIDVKGRTVILADDGIATGATTRAALRSVRAQGARKLVLAVPVAPSDVLREMARDADDIICLEDYIDFGGIGAFYRDFHQVSDGEVQAILDRFLPAHPSSHTSGE